MNSTIIATNQIFIDSKLLDVVLSRIVISLFDLPTSIDWLVGLSILSIYTAIALPLGVWQGFLRWNSIASKATVIKISATSLIAPALLEELFFRAVLLPHPSENASLKTVAVCSIVGLLLFVIYHPLNGLTFFPKGRSTFLNPVFLILATLLGFACTIAYLYAGSILISVVIHWLTVIVWLLCLDGINRLKIISV